jgi:hypothetical protein
MHRVLAVLIALLLGGGVVAAVVKSDDNEALPIVQPSPSDTSSFDGAAPTESFTETASPLETSSEEPSVSPTTTLSELPRTGSGSFVPAAFLTLGIAVGAGIAVIRAARRTSP